MRGGGVPWGPKNNVTYKMWFENPLESCFPEYSDIFDDSFLGFYQYYLDFTFYVFQTIKMFFYNSVLKPKCLHRMVIVTIWINTF